MNFTQIEADFEKLIASFQAIATIESRVKQEFYLSRIASWHGITRADCRRLFRLFCCEELINSLGVGGVRE
ncbi:hypothetical protein [Nostoc sp. FACHB-190]|uniref:hypothetical protein n=1 Tax=Nostoc sp. FACHB-190 TaxID=2692838 RepID=UPI00168296EF|nr:hypothetical protein [Nostoc sp. FACHB-190]MBD2298949.1 hypothetical protein [Nostoc sp. FACHB-190]